MMLTTAVSLALSLSLLGDQLLCVRVDHPCLMWKCGSEPCAKIVQ